MAPSTFDHQGTPPGTTSFSSSNDCLETSRSPKPDSLPRTIVSGRTTTDPPPIPEARFPVEAQLSFKSAVRKRRLAPYLLEKIQNFREGNEQGLPTTGVLRHVRQKDYNELNDLLEKDPALEYFAFRQLKIIYNPKRRRLSYNMPGPVHEATIDGVADLINDQLKDIRTKWTLPDVDGKHQENLAEQIRSRGSTRVKERTTGDKTDPDKNWIFTGGGDRSCFTLEVANSQNYGEIREKAKNLISKCRGRPGMVLIISISYNEPNAKKFKKAAAYTILALRDVKQKDGSVKRQVDPVQGRTIIRDSSGKAQGGSISFTIKDMLGLKNEEAYEKKRNSEDPVVAMYTAQILDTKIELSFAAITKMIEEGEETAKLETINDNNPDSEDEDFETSDNFSPEDSVDSWPSSESDKQEDPDDGTYKPSHQGENENAGKGPRRSRRLAKA
ncbi:uncharacterized protein LTHEOB_6409 [Lasiodiplodia theobromae]|uniref:uncharacterized protein n=1 Tax=Lasiodiplodia theobromae TaxID=45133 RepID=UPI0015C3D12E|nr:uncharacterized protein LTHEOB_6409 [Lasiodiplodia theobromae]KAF4544291.1 hypothetical protein LTHEOB_6409 [Lasiodiplodia theobromae]